MDVADARTRLEEDGVALLAQAIHERTLSVLREAAAACRTTGRPMSRQVLYTRGPAPPGRPPLSAIIDQWLNPHRYDDGCSTRVAADAVRPIARELLGGEPVLFQDLLLLKRQGQREFPWHQDFGFWPVDRPQGLVLWIPLDRSDGESGALRFAVGSHRLGPRPPVDLHDGRPQGEDADLGFNPEAFSILAPTYRTGDAVVFSPLTFHSSPPMSRDGERIAWSCVFMASTVRWQHARAPNHPICRHTIDGAEVGELSGA